MPSQMNGCHVPGQTGAIQNPAYRPTGKFSFYSNCLCAPRDGARKYLFFLIKKDFRGDKLLSSGKCLNAHGKPFVKLNGI